MTGSITDPIEKLRTALATLQAQDTLLGEAIEPAIAATRQQIERLEAQAGAAGRLDEFASLPG